MKTLATASGLAMALLAISACGGDPEPPPAPPQQASRPAAAAPRPAAQPDDAARRAREAEAAAARAKAEAEAARRTTLAEVVYFDFDQSMIRGDSRAALDRKARILREAPTVRIRVEGHADERGSTEYNLALGSRRAESVRTYLTGVGINASRIEVMSYGEGRPAQRGANEASWSRNRRSEFTILSGVVAND